MPCEIFLGGINMTDTMEEVLEMRRMWKKSDDARDAGLPREVSGVRRIDDLSYGPDPKWHLLDLYLPENVEGKIPVIINVHGGGYCYGTKETYQFYGLNLAAHGFAFVSLDGNEGGNDRFSCIGIVSFYSIAKIFCEYKKWC